MRYALVSLLLLTLLLVLHFLHLAIKLDLVLHHPDRNICRSNTLNGWQKPKLLRPSVASGGSYDNALAETINGLFKAELIHRRGPWGSFEAVEYATLEWVDWFNNRRLPESIGDIAPTEVEANYHAALERSDMAT